MSNTKDFIVRGITRDGYIKAVAVQSTELVEHARQIHQTLPLGTAALGRALSAVSMMGDEIKDPNGSITLQFRGDGPLGSIVTVSDSEGNVRGYVQNPACDIPRKAPGKLDVGAGVGAGVLTVIKDVGEKEPFAGKVELLSGEIAEDIAYYYYASEQLPTICALGVLVDVDQSVKQAGGYMIQLLPGAPEEIVFILEERVEEEAAAGRSVTSMMEQGMDAKAILEYMLDRMGYEELYQQRELERAVDAFLAALPAEERKIFVARYWFVAPVKEIAARLNCSPGKVKTTLYRLRGRLRGYLQEEGLL